MCGTCIANNDLLIFRLNKGFDLKVDETEKDSDKRKKKRGDEVSFFPKIFDACNYVFVKYWICVHMSY